MVSLSRWADEIDDEDFIDNDTPSYSSTAATQKDNFLRPKEGERIVTEVKIEPDTGKKVQVHRTFRLEKKFGELGTVGSPSLFIPLSLCVKLKVLFCILILINLF